ncbi:MAG: hypothetical protein ACI841_002637 [Planctomycetota bacterium]
MQGQHSLTNSYAEREGYLVTGFGAETRERCRRTADGQRGQIQDAFGKEVDAVWLLQASCRCREVTDEGVRLTVGTSRKGPVQDRELTLSNQSRRV